MLDGWTDGWAGSVRYVCDCLGISFLEGSADCVARWLGNAMHRRGVGDSWLVYWLRYRGIYILTWEVDRPMDVGG